MKIRFHWVLSSLFSILAHCTGSLKSPITDPSFHDCARFTKIVKALVEKGDIDQPVWRYSFSDRDSPGFSIVLENEGGEGLICEAEVAAGGRQVWSEGALQSKGTDEVSYSFRVYTTAEHAARLASLINEGKGGKVMLNKNRIFTYFLHKTNRRNISKVIVKAAEDFLKETE